MTKSALNNNEEEDGGALHTILNEYKNKKEMENF